MGMATQGLKSLATIVRPDGRGRMGEPAAGYSELVAYSTRSTGRAAGWSGVGGEFGADHLA
jgi:hypothetical protein